MAYRSTRNPNRGRWRWLWLCAAPLAALADGGGSIYPPDPPPPAPSDRTALPSEPQVAIVIDDLGYQWRADRRAAQLHGALTYAILPHTPHGTDLARLVHAADKEVVLHLPMEPHGHANPGEGALHSDMTRSQVRASLHQALRTVPYAAGISNHMGSRLTALSAPMGWLMEAITERGNHLFYLDSRTTPHSVSEQLASAHGVPHLARDVFLDNERSRAAIRRQFEYLLRLAVERGRALAIAHPYSETLDVLERVLPELPSAGIRLVFASTFLVRGEHLAARLGGS